MGNNFEKENVKLSKENLKLEKQNKKLKKKTSAGGKVILFLLLIIVILAAVLFFLDPFGWGIGPNAKMSSGGGSTASTVTPSAVSSAPEQAAEESEAPKVTKLTVTVSGATFTMDGAETTAEKIVDAASKADGEVMVEIKDDNATQNAMEELRSALEKAGIAFDIAANS